MDADKKTLELDMDAPRRSMKRLVRRAAFICKYCDGVYADEPVTSCDCLGYLDQKPPHFIKGKIEYRLPNADVMAAADNKTQPKQTTL